MTYQTTDRASYRNTYHNATYNQRQQIKKLKKSIHNPYSLIFASSFQRTIQQHTF